MSDKEEKKPTVKDVVDLYEKADKADKSADDAIKRAKKHEADAKALRRSAKTQREAAVAYRQRAVGLAYEIMNSQVDQERILSLISEDGARRIEEDQGQSNDQSPSVGLRG